MDQFQHGLLAKWKMLMLLAGVGLAPCANAQPAPHSAASGKQLAEQYCVSCHVIAPSNKGGWTDAPAFDAIANRQGVTAAQLSATIQKPHMNMLNDERPKPEADAIAAYIVSLRKR